MTLEKLQNAGIPGQRPLLCLEVNPPRGVDLRKIFARLDAQVSGIDFFNVTDSALARMKCSALPFAAVLKERYGIEPLVNISCRDRNRIALQADLLAGWMAGVRSIIALTGDAVSVGDLPEAKGVFDLNSVDLLKLIEVLNSGSDLAGKQLRGAPSYCPGAVVNPNAKNIAAELKKLKRKKAAGAKYALSQPIFEAESSREFFTQAQAAEMPIFLGLLPVASSRAARALTKIPGIRVSDAWLDRIDTAPESGVKELSLEHSMQLAECNREYVCGFHVISGATPKLALRLARRLVEQYK